jgi:hypothetical protein
MNARDQLRAVTARIIAEGGEPIIGVTQDDVDAAYESAFPRVLEAIAQGATKTETLQYLAKHHPAAVLLKRDRERLLSDALDDALSCGIEREDIDESWI